MLSKQYTINHSQISLIRNCDTISNAEAKTQQVAAEMVWAITQVTNSIQQVKESQN
jgi:hypothetical protein